MKKGLLITLAVIAVIVIATYSFFTSNYNKMVSLQENTELQWSQVENQYQRRNDLIPNLVATVKGYAAHESETLTSVIEARSKATQTTISVNSLGDKSAMQNYAAAQGELSSALARLMAVSERYPDLKANQNFLSLQAQLEGTENRISTERGRFNESARAYNTFIKSFPKNILAGMFDFEAVEYFEAAAGAQKPVEVKF